MSRTFCRWLTSALLMVVLLFTSQPAFACGPFALEAVFTFAAHPEFPLENFARGEIGVLQASFARSYLFAAYRHFSGRGLSAKEQKDLLTLWKERMDYTWPDFDESWPQPWLEARQTIAGVGTAPQISTSRHRDKPNQYETYVNCQKDAFEIAATTLTARAKKFGADSAVMKEWVAAQDSVFANCSEGTHLPVAAPADADALIRADRAYQIGAAYFYSAAFDDARQSFETIAKDPASPWRPTAAYLVGRTLLRKASLGPAEQKSDSLGQAEAVLKKVLNDRGVTPVHSAAAKLLSLVRLRLHPEVRVHELAQTLQNKDDETLKQDLSDYTILLDDFVSEDTTDPKSEFPASLRQDDLTDWIVTVQTAGETALTHSLERWRATSSPAWLVAALSKTRGDHPQAESLTAAAKKIAPGSPAFPSAAFHEARLAIEAGKFDQGRAKLDEVLAKHRARLPASSLNLFLELRMQVASSLNDLLTYVQSLPAGFTWNEDGREIPVDFSEETDLDKSTAGQKLFAPDAARTLNERLPLGFLQQAAESKALPENLRRDLVQAAWLRAVLLDDSVRAQALAPTLKILVPATAPLLDKYLSTQPEDARKFSAIYTWLKVPGLQPIVGAGVGRESQLATQNEYRDNWWCAAASSQAGANEAAEQQTEAKTATFLRVKNAGQFPLFLTEAQKAAARAQHARLASFGAAPDYLCRQVIAWVEKHPSDARGPEALHLAVKTTRYGCTDKETGKWSKAAHDLLHKRFPGNPWTKKTPYWFKD